MKSLYGAILISVACLAVTTSLTFCAQSDGERSGKIVWAHQLSEALAQASSGDKLIIVDLVADWCGWCRQMEATTWTDPRIAQLATKYVFLRLNGENEKDGIGLIEKFQIDGYPTVMLLNADGSEFDRFEGYMSADQLLARLNASIANPQTLGNLIAQEKQNSQDLSLQYKVGQALFKRNEFKEAEVRFRQVVEQDSENKSNVAESAFIMLALCQASERNYTAALTTLESFQKSFPEANAFPKPV